MNIYKYLDYRDFLVDWIKDQGWGAQARLSQAARCQSSYLSRVLNHSTDLSQEQAMRIAMALELRNAETEYLLDLVLFSRATFSPLKAKIKERIERSRAASTEISKRVSSTTSLDATLAQDYYGSWIPSALHILLGCKQYSTEKEVSERLAIPLGLVNQYMRQLEGMGLIENKGGRWANIPGDTHLPKGSPMLPIHHQNWRAKAVLDSQLKTTDGLHYTSIQTHSLMDYHEIKSRFLNFIEECRAIVRPSPTEEVSAICLDFFRA